MNNEKPDSVNFSQFWVHVRRSDGKVTTAPLFDEDAFCQMFGIEAFKAFSNYEHFSGNPPKSSRGKKMMNDSRAILREKGLDPEVIHDAHKNARIEDA